MVIADPSAELVRLVTGPGDPPAMEPTTAGLASARLLRQRFGLALPPPFAGSPSGEEPVRVATAHDAAAIGAVKWRCFGINYRQGVLADDFLDGRDVVPPVSYWQGRAMVPPSRFHRLLVWGRPGCVFGYADLGPVHPEDGGAGPADGPGEVAELYVDPTAQGRGGGAALLAAAVAFFASVGWTRAELSVIATNEDAQGFYRSQGWEPTGAVRHLDLVLVAFDELRWARPI